MANNSNRKAGCKWWGSAWILSLLGCVGISLHIYADL